MTGPQYDPTRTPKSNGTLDNPARATRIGPAGWDPGGRLAFKLLRDGIMARLTRTLTLLSVGAILGAGLAIGVERWLAAERSGPVTTAQVFQDVLSAIRDRYVDSLTDDELYSKAAKGVVSTLGDPYSAFLGRAEYGRYHDLLVGRGRSIGIRLDYGLAGAGVAGVTARGPGDRAGLRIGDYLLAVNGVPALAQSAAKVANLLRGETSDSVRVRFRSPGDSIVTEVVIRPELSRIPAATAPVWLTDSTAYVGLSSVSTDAGQELRTALGDLPAGRLKSLVLDLRGNGGGPLQEAIGIADLFLAPGQRIGAVSKRQTRWATYFARKSESYGDVRLTILVDRRTASSAEIIAAALRDNQRALLVGEKTFGKGLIQTTIQLGDSAALRLTTGRWEGPGGRLIAGGIVPDSVVSLQPREALLRRVLAKEPGAVARTLDQLVAAFDSTQTAPLDSLSLSRADRDLMRSALNARGILISRRMAAVEHRLFDLELRRVTAVARGDRAMAARYALLNDPVVAAGLALAVRAR